MIQTIAECFIKPKCYTEEAKEPIYLTPTDLFLLSFNYSQKALLFPKPQPTSKEEDEHFIQTLLDRLKESLSVTLVHFYPLAGQFEFHIDEEHSRFISINPNKGPGAKFIHATATPLTMSDILSPTDVPEAVQSFFDDNAIASYDGHEIPLLSVKVTELVDGISIGCSANHGCIDGTSYWNFFNAWSEIFKSKSAMVSISRPPIHKRWFEDGIGPIIKIPFTRRDEIVLQFESTPPPLRERIFHFSAESVAAIKEKANNPKGLLEAIPKDYKVPTTISSFQALTALVWRCITRARITTPRTCSSHDDDVETGFTLVVNTRGRLYPPLSENYFGNSIQSASGSCKAKELLGQSLSWAAVILNRTVASCTDNALRTWIREWVKSPAYFKRDMLVNPTNIVMVGSPRFDMYRIEFGMGKAVAVFSGHETKYDGRIGCLPGRDGGGSIDLDICLYPHHMSALESDKEFIDWVS